jgi:hypothetical protein
VMQWVDRWERYTAPSSCTTGDDLTVRTSDWARPSE